MGWTRLSAVWLLLLLAQVGERGWVGVGVGSPGRSPREREAVAGAGALDQSLRSGVGGKTSHVRSSPTPGRQPGPRPRRAGALGRPGKAAAGAESVGGGIHLNTRDSAPSPGGSLR